MIDAVAEVGFARASVAEVGRRAGVSKGVVTYHFAAKDDLVRAVIEDVLGSMREYLEPPLYAAKPLDFPERFIAAYVTEWAGYYRTHSRQVLALVRIYNSFRDESGRPNPAFDVRADDIAIVAGVLSLGQDMGRLGSFDAHVMAALMKAALDDLLSQFSDNPELDLESYAAALVTLFEQATRPIPAAPGGTDETLL
jgi:TetR/AcrR family transcriptional regulator, fatty acid metabolism regulator protein